MAKLGWIVSGLLTCLFVVGATSTTADDQITQKLDELKAIATESLKIQKLDTHRRLWPNHKLTRECDFESACDRVDHSAANHRRLFRHPESDKCSDYGICKELEKKWIDQANKEEAEVTKRIETSMVASDEVIRAMKEASIGTGWILTANNKDFDNWLKVNADGLDDVSVAFLKTKRAEKAKGK